MQNDIRQYIRSSREAARLSRHEVGGLLGWSSDRVGRIETGRKTSLAAEDLALLAEVIPGLSLTKAMALLEESAQQQLAERAGSSAA